MPKPNAAAHAPVMPYAAGNATPAEFIDPATLPREYGLKIAGDCRATGVKRGDLVVVDSSQECRRGDVVVLYFRPDCEKPDEPVRIIARLAMNVPPGVRFPYRESPTSEVAAAIIIKGQSWRCGRVLCADLLAIHRCVEMLPSASADSLPKPTTSQKATKPRGTANA